jgi:tetratricopeptide (TPR) repeat protein
LESLGKAYTQQGDRSRGVEQQSLALAIRQETGDQRGELASINALGLARLRNHEPDTALRHFQRSQEIAAHLADDYWAAVASNNIANALIDLDRPGEAVPLLRDALAGYRRLSILGGAGDALRGMSHAHRLLGVPERARHFIDTALSIARDRKNPAWEAFWSLEAGQVRLALGDPAEALVLYQRAASMQRQLGDRIREAAVLDATGEAYSRSGRPVAAVAFHRYAVDVFRQCDEKWRLAVACRNLGAVLLVTEGARAAANVLDEAVALFAGFGDPAALRHRAELDALRGGGDS